MNALISVSAFLFGASFFIFLYNMVASWRSGPAAPPNPWRARTLEWQVDSPAPIFNFDRIPTVVGGPYEYGVPGAVHGVFDPADAPAKGVASAGRSAATERFDSRSCSFSIASGITSGLASR